MGDPRPEGRDAVAVITALLPIYTMTEEVDAEREWVKASPMLVNILRDKDRSDLVAVLTHIGHMAAMMAVQLNPEDPYEIVREIAKGHV